MKKSPKRKKRGQKKESKYSSFQQPPKNWSSFFLRNLLFALISVFLIHKLYEKKEAYHWVYKNLLADNLKIVKEHPDYTMNQKQQAKLGFYAKYLYYIDENTPDSAIILMPPDSIVDKIDEKYKMEWLSSKRHTTYFLYPRKAIYYSNANDSVYFNKITHVAIVDGFGYQYLPYRVRNKSNFTVLPLEIKTADK